MAPAVAHRRRQRLWRSKSGSPGRSFGKNKYLYNGKELSTDYEINLYEYGARWYDPATSRFTSIDRFAEKYAFQSPYTYAANNPVKFIDVNGDSINVAAVASASPEEWAQTLSELQEFTGLELSIDKSGNMAYKKSEGKLSGSNKIRLQLGSNFGQRMVYNQFIVPSDRTNEYHAFSRSALRSLVAGKVPTGGYVKVPR